MHRFVVLAVVVLPLQASCGSSEETQAPAGPSTGFATRREHAIDAKPTSLLAEDLDGDGKSELVITDPERGELRVWKGGAPWTTDSARVVSVGGWPLAPVVLPREGRSRRRVAVASRARRDLAVFDLCDKVPGLELRRVDLPETPRAMAAGDHDMVIACDGGRLAIVGPSGQVRVVAIPDGIPRCALVIGDGSVVVLGYQDRRSLVIVDPTGAGKIAGEIVLGGMPRAMHEADLDGDGDLELVAAGGDGSLWVLGFGEKGASIPSTPPLEWPAEAIPIDLESADLDGDGKSELVWLAYHDLTWNIGGRFTREGPSSRATGYAGQSPCALALLDRDGDGRLDLVVANRDSQSVSLARGLGAEGFATPTKVPVGRFPTSLLAGDLDRDGRADLVVLESKDDTASVVLNRAGKLERGLVLATGPDPRAAQLSDLDGDGKLDLAVVSDDSDGSGVRVWFGDGAGGLAHRPEEAGPQVGRGVRALLAADTDGDGRSNWITADAERSEVTLWPGPPLAVRDGPCALAAIELDGDAGPEVAVALGTGVAFLDSEGGRLREIARIETGGPAIALAPADLDRDGFEDLAVLVLASRGSSNGEVHGFLREKSDGARFRLAGRFATSAHPRSIATGDLDRDGLPDLVVPAQYAHRVDFACSRRAARNLPWRFEVQDALGAGIGCMDAVVADLDGDGRLDVAVANGHTDDVTILFATGR